MSEEGFGETAIEKLCGFIILLVGIVSIYYTLTSSSVLGLFTGLFSLLGVILVVLGVFLLIVKVE
jgi:hypothetical protein